MMLGFQIGIKDIIDILLITLIFYEGYRLLRRSGAVNLFWGILAIVVIWFVVSYVFALELTGALFDRIISVGAIALIVLFQDEIRSFLLHIGSRFSVHQLRRQLHTDGQQQRQERAVMQIVLAVRNMAKTKTGVLLVFARTESLHEYIQSGEKIDSVISDRLIENIFFKNTPLHDGALIITAGRLNSAACILPVSKNLQIPQHYGLRHRAALGVVEKTDAIAVVVSEETGEISIAMNEQIRAVKIEELQQILATEVLF